MAQLLHAVLTYMLWQFAFLHSIDHSPHLTIIQVESILVTLSFSVLLLAFLDRPILGLEFIEAELQKFMCVDHQVTAEFAQLYD